MGDHLLLCVLPWRQEVHPVSQQESVQGQADSLFPLDQADDNARAITGAPVKVVWYQGGHDGGEPETARLRALERGWFDRYLRSGAGDPASFTVTRAVGIDSSTQRPAIIAASDTHYPGMAGERQVAVPLAGPAQTVRSPAGGSPAAISALPGLGALTSLPGFLGAGVGTDSPSQQAVFDSSALGAPVQLTGAARLRIHVSGAATLFAKLYDVGPDGQAIPARRLAAPLRVSARSGGDAEARLPVMDYRFDRGHRIRVVLAATDMEFASPVEPAAYRVSVTSPLSVPVEQRLRIAREIHDVAGRRLTTINMQAAVGLYVVGRRPDKAQEMLTAIKKDSKTALNRLREKLAMLADQSDDVPPRGPMLGLGGLDALISTVNDSGLRVVVVVRGARADLAAAVDLAAFRIVQHALANVLRHASSTFATVLVDYTAGGVRLEITDDRDDSGDIGDEAEAAGMRERASSVGGVLTSGPSGNGGHHVRAVLPLR